jgi:hypothetical protein
MRGRIAGHFFRAVIYNFYSVIIDFILFISPDENQAMRWENLLKQGAIYR